jgi:predicted aspartyl protease
VKCSTACGGEIYFIVDTGFDGGLVLSEDTITGIDAVSSGYRIRQLADDSVVRCRVYEMFLETDDESQSVEILAMDGNPLLGTEFLREHSLYAELTDGGEVQINSLSTRQ